VKHAFDTMSLQQWLYFR